MTLKVAVIQGLQGSFHSSDWTYLTFLWRIRYGLKSVPLAFRLYKNRLHNHSKVLENLIVFVFHEARHFYSFWTQWIHRATFVKKYAFSNCTFQVADERFLVLINNLLASGEIPDLFSDDEVENVVTMVRNEVKGAGMQDTRENCWKFFIDR